MKSKVKRFLLIDENDLTSFRRVFIDELDISDRPEWIADFNKNGTVNSCDLVAMKKEVELSYWSITEEDGRSILTWDCQKLSSDHKDNIEMSGLYTSFIVGYGIEGGKAVYTRNPIFPMLRTIPNDTHASYQLTVENQDIPNILANGTAISETAVNFKLNGSVECNSVFEENGLHLDMRHNIFPTTDKQAVCEKITITNAGTEGVALSLDGETEKKIGEVKGAEGTITAMLRANLSADTIAPGETATVSIVYSGTHDRETELEEQKALATVEDVEAEYNKRMERVKELESSLVLDTGNDLFDTMFAYAQVRAGESIYRTQNGDVHSPGGGGYYAAVWCNDQAEYAGPWHAYTGDELQVNAAYNAYSWYYPWMTDEHRAMPSSIIAEGTFYWNGAGDRGDAAMYLYGASRYALICGNMGENNELWDAIKWCAEYCMLQKNEEGVITSNTDELEFRLPAGEANLCTSMLTLGGLRYAARIANDLGETSLAKQYRKDADALEKASEKYFGSTIRGFETYKYYKENTTLRSWICMPLCVDVFTRAEGTIDAIVSPYLMSAYGQLSEEGTDVVWDRATLYGIRGIARAGAINAAWNYMQDYCTRRLLGNHVPYAIEAYPEGGMRHLSGESALFCQIVTDGILAIDPLSFDSFSFIPQLADDMDHLTLSNISAFGEVFEISVTRDGWEVTTESGKEFSGRGTKRVTIDFSKK